MKRFLFIAVVSALIAVPAMADMVNFYASPYTNVDTTTGFGGDGQTNLGYGTISVLGGDATLTSRQNGSAANFSQRETRGLGVFGYENDEVDTINLDEHIDMVFNTAYYVNSVDLRSLFTVDPSMATETAEIELYRSFVAGSIEGHGGPAPDQSWIVAANELFPGTVGSVVTNLGGILLNPGDALVFRVYDAGEFAVAALDVTAVPIPGAVLLGMLGLGYAGRKLRKMC